MLLVRWEKIVDKTGNRTRVGRVILEKGHWLDSNTGPPCLRVNLMGCDLDQ